MNAFIQEPRSLDDLAHNRAVAASMSARCPICEADSMVTAQHRQATRAQPAQFLGAQGFCKPCQVAFEPTNVQLVMQ